MTLDRVVPISELAPRSNHPVPAQSADEDENENDTSAPQGTAHPASSRSRHFSSSRTLDFRWAEYTSQERGNSQWRNSSWQSWRSERQTQRSRASCFGAWFEGRWHTDPPSPTQYAFGDTRRWIVAADDNNDNHWIRKEDFYGHSSPHPESHFR